MNKPQFAAMSKVELKRYLLENRNDTEAFHALMDKINAEPNPKFYTIDEIGELEKLIEAKRTRENL
ncbi:hypothetical protein CDG77_07595 [Nostoc sp. 'Peltigera membranacea cyanobiont' 213]|uniref:DUF6887 family protein n=1 Tax=unclassified Nostoc TaxID=2593658 RepID=UPI000B9590A1|nr:MULTISPECIES: hypothetical protein [unclassified Nostoc]AVH63309.1 hypothetical protein NPM_1485 [Nostoc sp. 'Peltigera membranacea cyanobiont' N6]MBN3872072.1 hypothetical protein [Nostoc sp. JL33]MEA5603924.1 hypothetical protein [Nostoc sp. UHCC 0252]OYD97211.1 hypothetical protein CDG77_07595 [Nostoc sp. 'Peltigera membranacea cyanobiont' 213]